MSVATAPPISPVQQNMDLTSINTHPHLVHGRRAGPQIRDIREHLWPWRRWLTTLWQEFFFFFASIRRIPYGQNRDPLRGCRSVTRPCCSIPLLSLDRSGERSAKTTKRSAKYRCRSMQSRRFRQLDSRCPGHPEYRWDIGRGNHHGAARPRRRHQRRHGHRPGVAGLPATTRLSPALRICLTSMSTRFVEMDA